MSYEHPHLASVLSTSRISPTGGAALHALQMKSHAPKAHADNFADMLADADAAAPQPKAEARNNPRADAPKRQETEDTTSASAEARPAQAPVERPRGDDKKESDVAPAPEASERHGAANDNDNDAVQPDLPQPAQTQPAPLLQQFAAQAAAPVLANTQQVPEGDLDSSSAQAPAAAQAPDAALAQAEHPAEIAKGQTDSRNAANPAEPDTGFQKLLDAQKAGTHSPDDAPAKPADVTAAHADLKPADPAPAAPAHTAAPQTASVNSAVMPAQPASDTVAAAPTTHSAAAQTAQAPAHAAHTPDVNNLAVAIFARSQSGAKQFDIRLDPPELGRVEVRLSIESGGKAQAHLTADHADTLTLLRQDAPALTRALREAGLDVSQDGLNFSLRSQQQQEGGGQQGRGHARGNFPRAAAIESAAPVAESRASSLLDIRV